jgi:RND family efflux transporter MFP subunit
MQARIEQDKLVIRSPFNGYIADLPLVVGNVVQPGNLIVSVEDHDAFKIVTFLSSSEVKKVHVGDPVHAGQEETVNIAAIAPSADAATKKYKVEMTYSGSVLKVGEFIELTFTAGDDVPSDPQIFIPVTAIHIQGTETFVWKIKGENGTARVAKTIVRLGPIEGAFVEVVEGLTDGDIIATKGGRIIEDDGTRVRIIDPLTTASGSHIP